MKEVLYGMGIWLLFSFLAAFAVIGFSLGVSWLLEVHIEREPLMFVSLLIGGMVGLFVAMGLCAK